MIERRQILVTVAVMVVAFGAVLAALIVLTWGDSSDGAEPAGVTSLAPPGDEVLVSGTKAAAGFLAAFRRSTESTFRIEVELTREVATGLSATSRFVLVQKPPRQLVRSMQGTEVGAFIGDRELHELTELVAGADSVYTVVGTVGGCWQLVLREFLPAAPLGTTTEYCFDEATGAPMYVHTSRAEGTDTMTTIMVTSEVADADFD
ncbi:MAG: hypothetical protein GY929_25130 [Actinomycetia bacterium]|nr:hypothetical protein [Actinomycetes bacterium]